MKLRKVVPYAVAGIAMFGMVSCQNHEELQVQSQEESNIEMTQLSQTIYDVITSRSSEESEDMYILFDASTGEYTTLSGEDYQLLNAFANVIAREDNSSTRAPEGNGWIKGGTGKGKTAAMKVALKLADKLEQQRDFEIHVEYAKDGSFTVWYRYV